MIQIGGNIANRDLLMQYDPGSGKGQIVNQMLQADTVFTYATKEFLDFELSARVALVNASERLYNSFFSFQLFKNSECNKQYWERTREGGFRLKPNAVPHEAVRDILRNSKLYGTECATAYCHRILSRIG